MYSPLIKDEKISLTKTDVQFIKAPAILNDKSENILLGAF
jgi:hypothetical protein